MKIYRFGIMLAFAGLASLLSCNPGKQARSLESLKQEIIKTEKEFEKAAGEKGIPEAFFAFADDSAVILRRNDSLIKGSENIRKYYENPYFKHVVLQWAPDFVDVSGDGTLAHSYGKYLRVVTDSTGKKTEVRGIFHTVWKRQGNGSWKYVWD
jgi:ketosteroid isomerase-like protein